MKMVPGEKKYFALFLIAVVALFLAYAALSLLAGIFGAAVLYVIFRSPYLWLEQKTKMKAFSAFIIMIISVLLILLPLSYLLFVAFNEAIAVSAQATQIAAQLETVLAGYGVTVPGMANFIISNMQVIAGKSTQFLINAANGTVDFIINMVVMYIILFYAFTEHAMVGRAIKDAIPFSEKNAERLMSGFRDIVKTTVIGNGIVAVMMGILFAAGLYLLGAGNILLWALVGSITAFLPMLGVQFVSIPAAIFYILTGNVNEGIIIFIWGSFLSYVVDGLLRQGVQKRLGNLHPFYSLVGLLVGIAYFGIMGIIIGPLILALFVLTVRMFREEYIPTW